MIRITTIAIALFPTALRFGEGAELRAPLAAAVLGGVISSTLLTLVLVPVMYTLLDSLPSAINQRVRALPSVLRRRGVRLEPRRAIEFLHLPQTNGKASTNGAHARRAKSRR